MGRALLGGGVEELLDESQLAVAADERRLEAGRLERASRRPDATRSAWKSWAGSALPFSSWVPASS